MKRDVPSENLTDEFNRVWAAIDKLKRVTSGRVLPHGYHWKVDSSEQLVIVREDDDAEQVVF